MKSGKALLLISLLFGLVVVWLVAGQLPAAGVFSFRHFLEGVAAGMASVAAVVWLAVAGRAIFRKGGNWSWRNMSREQRLRLVLRVSMGCLFTGLALRQLFPGRPWGSVISAVLVLASIPGNMWYLRQNRCGRQNG